ncbi:uncharacterized protein CG3556 [Caerostris extrusa]|uniref:Uncharacterized protein CG3556 n=1 Tax=Caerostris extrusa TaxID=172846 RepID=A0AAV4Y2U5_CAEEX|nr:uncharacterized protein CG3556 [Caerostris extrusa]
MNTVYANRKRGRTTGFFDSNKKCWIIPATAGKFIRININSISSQSSCTLSFLKLSVPETSDEYKLCPADSNKIPIVSLGSVIVRPYGGSYFENHLSFSLSFIIKDIECINKDSFRCDDNSCVSASKVCDGVKDCSNGADEVGCETGILAVKGIEEARQNAISWLKKKRSASWGWRDYTSRAVVALHLASDANFNGTILEEELMAKQTELKTAVALLRSSLTNSELSMFINSLLVTCHNPRKFYGHNLVTRLKEQVKESKGFTHPLAYLALCNAQESWPLKAISDLNNIINSSSNYPFIEAVAIIALSCNVNNTEDVGKIFLSGTLTLYENTISHFMDLQLEDGSFGNAYTTAFNYSKKVIGRLQCGRTQLEVSEELGIAQSVISRLWQRFQDDGNALISSGQEHSKSWKLNAAIEYLMDHLNSTSTDLLSTYLTLPLLNGKTLMDVSKINCSANPRKHGDDPVSELIDYLGPKCMCSFLCISG